MKNIGTILWIAVGTFMILGLTRLYGYLYQTAFYWTFHNLATFSIKDASVFGMVIVFVIPLTTGVLLVTASRKPLIGIATASGFLATLLQSWPILFFTNLRPHLVPFWLKGKPLKLFILQLLYIASYTLLCRAGAWIASRKMPPTELSERGIPLDSPLWTILFGIIVCLIWQVLSALWR